MSDLTYTVRLGIPGSLTIELQDAPRFRELRAATIYPPMREEPIVSPAPTSADLEQENPNIPRKLFSRAWGQGWAVPVSTRLNALGGNTNLQLIEWEAPSWDQTDNLWGATGTVDLATDEPVFTATLFGTSIYGRTFQNGDWILWNDATLAGTVYSYEIAQIKSVSSTSFTLTNRGAFNSVRTAHAGVNFYQLLDHSLFSLWDGSRQVYKFLWDKMIVTAISATTWGALAPSVVNLAAIPPAAAIGGLSTV